METRNEAEMQRLTDSRRDHFIKREAERFWERLAATFPEITTGDMPLEGVHALEQAMAKAATDWLEWNYDVGAQARAGGFDSQQICAMLKEIVDPESVELWHTGGGIHNPVVVLDRDADGNAQRYVMFSDGWYPEEGSYSLYNDAEMGFGDAIDHGNEQVKGHLALTPEEWKAVVREQLDAWADIHSTYDVEQQYRR